MSFIENSKEVIVQCPECQRDVKFKNFKKHYQKMHLKSVTFNRLESELALERLVRELDPNYTDFFSSRTIRQREEQLKEGAIQNKIDSLNAHLSADKRFRKCVYCSNPAMPDDEICMQCSSE